MAPVGHFGPRWLLEPLELAATGRARPPPRSRAADFRWDRLLQREPSGRAREGKESVESRVNMFGFVGICLAQAICRRRGSVMT